MRIDACGMSMEGAREERGWIRTRAPWCDAWCAGGSCKQLQFISTSNQRDSILLQYPTKMGGVDQKGDRGREWLSLVDRGPRGPAGDTGPIRPQGTAATGKFPGGDVGMLHAASLLGRGGGGEFGTLLLGKYGHREVNCNWAGSETEPETGRLRNPQWW